MLLTLPCIIGERNKNLNFELKLYFKRLQWKEYANFYTFILCCFSVGSKLLLLLINIIIEICLFNPFIFILHNGVVVFNFFSPK